MCHHPLALLFLSLMRSVAQKRFVTAPMRAVNATRRVLQLDNLPRLVDAVNSCSGPERRCWSLLWSEPAALDTLQNDLFLK